MTGKADAVRAVSQQFKDRTTTVIEGVMAHLRDDNANEILGSGLSPLIGRGSLKSIVTFALYADVLRMVRDMVMADGEISDEEVQVSLGLLSVVAAGFAKVRKEYAAFQQLTADSARQFLFQYESDAGLFGHANEATKWSGIELCRNMQIHFDMPEPLETFGGALVAWAEEIGGADELDATEQHLLESLRRITRCSPQSTAADDHGIAKSAAQRSAEVEEQHEDAAADDLLSEALLQAVNSGDVDALQESIQAGADIDHQYPEAGRRTALHLAVISGNMSVVQWLTLLGADLEMCDAQGQSALDLARTAGSSWIAEFLEERLGGDADQGEYDDAEEEDEPDEDEDEEESDEHEGEEDHETEDPVTKELNFVFGRMQWRAGNNEDYSDLLAEARALIAQGADTTFLRNLAAILKALKLTP
jgi:hypothetical protein